MGRENPELFSKETLEEIGRPPQDSGSAGPLSGAIEPETAIESDAPAAADPADEEEWLDAIDREFSQENPKPLHVAEKALAQHPTNAWILHLTVLAALVEERPDTALRYLKRLHKWYVATESSYACDAIALAMSGRWPVARNLLEKHDLRDFHTSFLFPPHTARWGSKWLTRIARWKPQAQGKTGKKAGRRRGTAKASGSKTAKTLSRRTVETDRGVPSSVPTPLSRYTARIAVACAFPDTGSYAFLDRSNTDRRQDFLLTYDFARVALLRGFEELLCLPHLHGVDHYWYQVETARKVLRRFRGRVLLADEVGLGKTIEAGMILKEYMLRGMVERVLILVPPSLVGQWRDELAVKFGIDCVTSHDPLMRRDPDAFWSSPRILASIATARMAHHADRIVRHAFDLVIVDEAHHLKNRSSRNWKLIDSLKKRFLLLLSATPVQNNLVELYNLLTLLKPGLFKTEKDFRSSYMTPGNPRVPLHRDRLQELMRDVMIRNTRALVDVRLPPRQVVTLRVDPLPDEDACYRELCDLIRLRGEATTHRRTGMSHLLQAAGSSAAAVSDMLSRSAGETAAWRDLLTRYRSVSRTAKLDKLFEIMGRNSGEKIMVFARYRHTLDLLNSAFRDKGLAFARFDGEMSGPQKDEAVESFRTDAAILLCSETGGEGRNLQFCNTMINFDVHWNPQVLEQRIGRIHRIGQEREVFVFNLVMRNTIEERILGVLDEKINMFELVVGEIQSILGEMKEDRDFTELVFAAWLKETEAERNEAFETLGRNLEKARSTYDGIKAFDDDLFGEEFEVV